MSNSPSWTAGHSGIAFYALQNNIHSLVHLPPVVSHAGYLLWQGCRPWCFQHSSDVSSDNQPGTASWDELWARPISFVFLAASGVLLTRQRRQTNFIIATLVSLVSHCSQGPHRVRSADPEKKGHAHVRFHVSKCTPFATAAHGVDPRGRLGKACPLGFCLVAPQQLGKSLKPPFSRDLA